MKKFLCLVLGTYFLFATTAQAQISDVSHVAQALKRSISLDADLTDWEGLPQYTVNLSNAETPEVFEQAGYYSVAWDDSKFYVLAVFQQAQADLTTGLSSDAEEWWLADTFELFVRLENYEPLHYATSPDGTPFKNFLSSINYESRSELREGEWLLELAFPLEADLPAVSSGMSWEFKVGRGYHVAQEFSLWPMGGDFLGESNYGLLYFTENLEDSSELFERLR